MFLQMNNTGTYSGIRNGKLHAVLKEIGCVCKQIKHENDEDWSLRGYRNLVVYDLQQEWWNGGRDIREDFESGANH